ncbi:hypothetical protein IBX65_02890 [Candidatus Aerophobetes bacterium]|nr:hypothetical protein [Candidatus Aerophobetes bacterium]
MPSEMTSEEAKIKNYPTLYAFTGTSREERIDISEVLDWLALDRIKRDLFTKPFFSPNILSLFEIDLSSSVNPCFEPVAGTSLTEEFHEEILPEEAPELEYDVAVRIPPAREYTIQAKIKSVETRECSWISSIKQVQVEWI